MITPGLGLVFWMTVTFAVLVFLLAKYAWKPILSAINERETSIIDALNQAKLAREEVQNLKSENERILKEARLEKDRILSEARVVSEQIISDAKIQANVEAERIIISAKKVIEQDKLSAVSEIKNQIGMISTQVAEVILKDNLHSHKSQEEFIDRLIG